MRESKGFTVMEMLVVLVLLSMITMLLMQGFSYVLQLRVRFLEQLEIQRTGILKDFWFRDLCSSLAPERPEGKWKFSGKEDALQGLSMAPLQSPRGTPTPIGLELTRQGGEFVLKYKEGKGDPLEIGRWPGGDGGFQYLDEGGNWHTQWPPPRLPSSQLPQGILLTVEGNRGPRSWYVALPGRHDPLTTAEDAVKEMFGKKK